MNRRQRRANTKHNEAFKRKLTKRSSVRESKSGYSPEDAEQLHKDTVSLLRKLEREGASKAQLLGWTAQEMAEIKDGFIADMTRKERTG